MVDPHWEAVAAPALKVAANQPSTTTTSKPVTSQATVHKRPRTCAGFIVDSDEDDPRIVHEPKPSAVEVKKENQPFAQNKNKGSEQLARARGRASPGVGPDGKIEYESTLENDN